MRKNNREEYIIYIALCLIIILTISFCSYCIYRININNGNDNECRTLIYDYFKYVKAGNIDKLDELFTGNRKSTISKNFIYEYIKIYSIKQDNNTKTIDDFKKHGHGMLHNFYDIRCYIVDFEYKYKDLAISDNSVVKRYKYDFFIIKEQKNSPWKIDDFGLEISSKCVGIYCFIYILFSIRFPDSYLDKPL